MSKRPTMTLEDVRRAIEAQNEQLAEAHDKVSGARLLPVTKAQLRQLSEASEPRVAATSTRTALPEWSALRC
jgi:hypothetical protein